jgi:beta-glucanase (GH16 family)
MRLVFNQTFDGPLNTSVWDTCYPWEPSTTGCTNFSNQEVEWYMPSQVQVTGGVLHLIGQLEATEGTTETGAPEEYACRSGMITSYPGFQFEYGYVSIVAQIPTGPGNWPGLWMAASNFQWPPEIDILEAWGPPISVAGVFYHPVGEPQELIHLSAATMASLSTGFHTFSLLWTPQELIWYLDNVPVMTITANIPHQMMYLLADLANFDGDGLGCTGQLLIRSIDVWQNP